MRFVVEASKEVPVAYIDLVEGRRNEDSAKQVVCDLSDLGFTPKELIFDLNADGNVIGVEIL